MSDNQTYQEKEFNNLKEAYPDFNIMVMHNEEERYQLATQVSDLTNGNMHFGDFKFNQNSLINENEKTIIILTEKALFEKALFEKVKSEFLIDLKGVNVDGLTFSIKDDISKIDYITREENQKGSFDFEGRNYNVYFKKGSHAQDQSTFILLDNGAVSLKESLDRKETLSSDENQVKIKKNRYKM